MASGTTDSAARTLPAQTSGFVGRAAELSRAPALLRRSRLVTITGPGGVGKTRLAVRVAGDIAGRYADGVHFAELSAVRDPRLLGHTVAKDTLGLAQVGAVDAALRLQTGEPRRCYEIASRTLELLPEGELWCTANLLGLQSVGLFLCGEPDQAKPPLRRCLTMKRALRDVPGTAFSLDCLAFIAAAECESELAAWLFGASAPLWERAGRWYTGAPAFEALHQVAERHARACLGDDRYWELHAAGATAPLDQVIERALGHAGPVA